MIDSQPASKNRNSLDRKTMSGLIDSNDSFSWFRKEDGNCAYRIGATPGTSFAKWRLCPQDHNHIRELTSPSEQARPAWNAGRQVGAKRALKPRPIGSTHRIKRAEKLNFGQERVQLRRIHPHDMTFLGI